MRKQQFTQEQKEIRNERARKWREEHADRYKELQGRYYKKNKEKVIARRRAKDTLAIIEQDEAEAMEALESYMSFRGNIPDYFDCLVESVGEKEAWETLAILAARDEGIRIQIRRCWDYLVS